MPRPKILIVDDEPGLVRLMTLMLKSRYEVCAVIDAAEALETVLQFRPDLILLDWVMPHLCGGDVAQQIRSDPRVCQTPILFLSAVVSKQDIHPAVAGYPAIAKPVGVPELVEAIERQLASIA